MLKVIVVDDEMLIRVGVKSCIEWEKHGFEIVAKQPRMACRLWNWLRKRRPISY